MQPTIIASLLTGTPAFGGGGGGEKTSYPGEAPKAGETEAAAPAVDVDIDIDVDIDKATPQGSGSVRSPKDKELFTVEVSGDDLELTELGGVLIDRSSSSPSPTRGRGRDVTTGRHAAGLGFAAALACSLVAACAGPLAQRGERCGAERPCVDGLVCHAGAPGEPSPDGAGATLTWCAPPGDLAEPMATPEPPQATQAPSDWLIPLGEGDVACSDYADCPPALPRCLAPERSQGCGPPPPYPPCAEGLAPLGCGRCAPGCAAGGDCPKGMWCDGQACLSPRRCFGAPQPVP